MVIITSILFFDNRWLESIALLIMLALFIRLRYILKNRGYDDDGKILGF